MIKFKKVHQSNLETIMHWRSSEYISRYLVTEIEKDMSKQRKWFAEKVKDNHPPKHWMICMNTLPIGFISMDQYIEKESTSWGYYIGEKKFWHMGGLISAYFYNYIFFKSDIHLQKIKGHYFAENLKIKKLHDYYGCVEVATLSNHVEKNGVMHDIIHIEMHKDVWLKKQEKFKNYIANFEE